MALTTTEDVSPKICRRVSSSSEEGGQMGGGYGRAARLHLLRGRAGRQVRIMVCKSGRQAAIAGTRLATL